MSSWIPSQPSAAIILAVGSIVYLFRSWILRQLVPTGIPGIPAYPDAYPFLGDIPRLASAIKATGCFSKFFDQVGHDLGPIAQLRLTPFKTMVVVNDYQEIDSITARHHQFDRADHTTGVFDNIIPTGQISLKTNDMWKQHRRLVGPAMTSKYLSMVTPAAIDSTRELIQLFDAKIAKADGRAWAVQEDFVSSAMDIICGMAFGKSWGVVRGNVGQVENGEVKVGPLNEAVFRTTRPEIAAGTMRLLDSVPIQSSFPAFDKLLQRWSPTWRRDYALVFGHLQDKLEESRASAKAKGESAIETASNTLDMIVARELNGDYMADKEILDEVFLYLVAGTETSAVTLTWYLKFMTNHPQVQHKLRKHLLERLPELQDRPLTFEDLTPAKVPYLEAVVSECLRLSRTASGAAREAKVDTSILGHHIPKGTVILLSFAFQLEDDTHPTWGGGESEDRTGNTQDLTRSLDGKRLDKGRKVGYWKAGTGGRFDPERWLVNGEYEANSGPTMPFSQGQRGCFGKNLALLELRLVIAHLTMAFFFQSIDESLNSHDFTQVITTHPKQSFIRPIRWEDL